MKRCFLFAYVDDWERLNETSLPEKEDFYSHLKMEYITDADYAHAKRVFKYIEIKYLGEYHNLCVHRDTYLLADVFEIFKIQVLKYMNLISLFFILYQI